MVLSHTYCCGPCLVLFRRLHISSILRINHYKTLGLSPSATQSEIKSAYYELSKKHHPDRNQGSEKSVKLFRNITAAYEVLGNEKLRKKYDESFSFRNIVHDSNNFDTSSEGYDDHLEKMFYEKKHRRFHRKYYYGKTPYYDFDAWYKAHYGKSSYNLNDDWLRNSGEKSPYEKFEEWKKSQEKKNNKINFESFKTYRMTTETMKKQESFFYRTEKSMMLVFYFIIIVTVLLRL